MAEQLNNSVTDETIDNDRTANAAPKENEIVSGETVDKNIVGECSDPKEFIKLERESFNARYAEIMKLIDRVGGVRKNTLPKIQEKQSDESVILTVAPRVADNGDKTKGQTEKSTVTVPINALQRVADRESLKTEPPSDNYREYDYAERSVETENGDSLDFYEDNIYPEPDYSEKAAFIPEFDTGGQKMHRPSLDGVYDEPDADKERDSFDEYNHGRRHEMMDIFERAELSKEISVFFRQQSSLMRRVSKLEDRQKNADSEENISLIVEKIGVLKELCELTIEILGSCVYLESKGKTARFKRILKTNIDKYNGLCDEYEGASGRTVEHLDYAIIDDVMAGKIPRPIPNVYYYGSEDDAVYDVHDEEYDRIRRIEEEDETVSREYERYLKGGTPLLLSDSERLALAKRKDERLSAIKRATERDLLLVDMRSEYALSELEAKRDILVRSYGLDKRKMVRAIRTIERRIEKINRNARKAVKAERENNSRYYLLCALEPADEKVKSGARRERLDALRARLNVLLSERESVNDRLIALYGGSDSKLKRSKISHKAAKIRRKSATAMYNSQRKLAKKIDKYRVPSDMKERAYDLLNKKTQAAATRDECIYKLKKLGHVGRAKRELVLEIKRAKASIRQLDREIRYVLRKLKRNQERYEDNKEWAAVLAFVFVIVAIGVALWILFGQNITAYFSKLAEQLGGG